MFTSTVYKFPDFFNFRVQKAIRNSYVEDGHKATGFTHNNEHYLIVGDDANYINLSRQPAVRKERRAEVLKECNVQNYLPLEEMTRQPQSPIKDSFTPSKPKSPPPDSAKSLTKASSSPKAKPEPSIFDLADPPEIRKLYR